MADARPAVQKIRVLLANHPRLMRELLVATICDQPDIEVMGEVADDSQISNMVAESQPDFLIISMNRVDERPAICDDLLSRHPKMRVLALAAEQNRSIFFWSSPRICSACIESSEDGILNALRGKSGAVEGQRVF
ncbi:MAG: response regulator transcription factor [Acidobacteriales bacterium]|nr:response regulator transcription factor [Terriglobales bacterium]